MIPPAVLVSFRIGLAFLSILCFRMELKIVLLSSVKNCVGFYGDGVESVDCFL